MSAVQIDRRDLARLLETAPEHVVTSALSGRPAAMGRAVDEAAEAINRALAVAGAAAAFGDALDRFREEQADAGDDPDLAPDGWDLVAAWTAFAKAAGFRCPAYAAGAALITAAE